MTMFYTTDEDQDDTMTKDGTPLPPGHTKGDGHDHDGDGVPSTPDNA